MSFKESFETVSKEDVLKELKFDTTEKLSKLEDEVVWEDKEKNNEKKFTWDEKTKSLNYFYIIWKRDVFMSLQLVWDQVRIVFDATNTLWWNGENEDKVIILPTSKVDSIPDKIYDTFEEWFSFSTLTDDEKIKVSNTDTLDTIKNVASDAITVLKKHIQKNK